MEIVILTWMFKWFIMFKRRAISANNQKTNQRINAVASSGALRALEQIPGVLELFWIFIYYCYEHELPVCEIIDWVASTSAVSRLDWDILTG